MDKKGFAISITFLVTLIMAIAIFAMSLSFLTTFFTQAEETRAQLSETTKARIEELLADGSRVAIPLDSKKVKRGKNAIFGLGILNTIPEKTHFYVDVSCSLGEELGRDACDAFEADGDKKYVLWSEEHIVENNKQVSVPIVISTTKVEEEDTFIFNVYVYSCDFEPCVASPDNQYDTVQKMYVTVD